jgi:hypothetical protein
MGNQIFKDLSPITASPTDQVDRLAPVPKNLQEMPQFEKLSAALGDPDPHLVHALVLHAAQGSLHTKADQELMVHAASHALAAFEPDDIAVAMLSAQMVAIHFQAMNLLKKAATSSMVDTQKSYINLSAKLLRTYANQMETLRRHRQNGQQKVQQQMTVDHVHVHEGAQAIVGNVTNDPKGQGA